VRPCNRLATDKAGSLHISLHGLVDLETVARLDAQSGKRQTIDPVLGASCSKPKKHK
jgi:hypothetical protein